MPPHIAFFLVIFLLPLLPRGNIRSFVLLLPPILSTALFFHNSSLQIQHAYLRIDELSFLFGLIFSLAALLAFVFSWGVRDLKEQIFSLLYAGTAIGALCTPDLLTFFIFWELVSLSSTFLIMSRGTQSAMRAGFRYFMMQMLSGLLLLAGIVLYYQETHSLAFQHMELGMPGTYFILIAIGVKCAFPLLHNWLQDAYPSASPTASVILSIFSTKLGIYALARGFAGAEPLIFIGVAMTLFPIFYAAIENNLRRILSYSLNNQLGFMVVGIGVGTPMALNGAVAHAFCHIIYKSLLFMSVGAVLLRAGTEKASDIGKLYKTMPLTTLFCIIGAASISAVPLFSGFISKALILEGVWEEGYQIVWFLLLVASVGVLEHAGLRIPSCAFFGHGRARSTQEAPLHMLLAMGAAALLCIGIGLFPTLLYNILPYQVSYAPYTFGHVFTQSQMLLFAFLAFLLIKHFGFYPLEIPSVNLDFDVVWRRALPNLITRYKQRLTPHLSKIRKGLLRQRTAYTESLLKRLDTKTLPPYLLETRPMILWLVMLLAAIALMTILGESIAR